MESSGSPPSVSIWSPALKPAFSAGRTDDDLTEALARVGELDRLSCRTWASQRFSLELMAKAYEERYLLAIEG